MVEYMQEVELMNERIKQLRKELKLNQTDFGARIGATQAMITSYETGRVVPDNAMRLLICTEFNVRREWLELGLEPMREEQLADDPAMLVPDLMDTLSAYPAVLDLFRRVVNHMTPADWDRLNQLIDDIQNKNPQA